MNTRKLLPLCLVAALAALLTAVGAPAAGGHGGATGGAAAHQPDIGKHFEKIKDAYFDFFAQVPDAYTCELRSPELVASMDEKGRQAWGNGHVLVTKTANGLRLSAEDIADPNAKPLFDLVLGLWQIKVAIDLKMLQARGPEFLAACALGALAVAATAEPFEKKEGQLLRFGVRAKNRETHIQEISFLVTKDYAVKNLTVLDNQGGSFEADLENVRSKASGNKWLVSSINARLRKPNGEAASWDIKAAYTTVGNYVVHEKLMFNITDGNGRPIKKNPKDVNPVSYLFANYKLVPSATSVARPADANKLSLDKVPTLD